MPRTLMIPGIPLSRGFSGLSGLTEACAFKSMPRGPVKFRENPAFVPLRKSPPLPPTPAAPRHVAFRRVKVLPPPPPRFSTWQTVSMAKSGVTRAQVNRVIAPSPSQVLPRIPVRAKAPSPKKDSSRARDHLRVSESSEPSLPAPCTKVRASVARPSHISLSTASAVPRLDARRTARQDRSRPWVQETQSSTARATAKSTARQTDTAPRSILVKPQGTTKKPKKCVQFGDVTVHKVNFWIDRKRDIFNDGGSYKLGRLQGWRVTPLSKPDEDGLTEHFMTKWGHDHSTLWYHESDKSCGQADCAWNNIALVRHKLVQAGFRGFENHEIIATWNGMREKIREYGGFAL